MIDGVVEWDSWCNHLKMAAVVAAAPVAAGSPRRRQMTVAGGLASATHRRLSESTLSSTSRATSLADAHDVELPVMRWTRGASVIEIHRIRTS